MKRAAIVVLVLAAVAAVVVLSGVISVKASSGHLPVTAWVLDLAKVRSVTMRARAIDAPALDDPALVRLGAAHFDTGCRPCHGAPGSAPPVVPSRMTPHPPDLSAQVRRWRPRELFYLVAHGVKFTGMPAWPAASRTDEAWAVVAFLRRLPDLDGPGYRALVAGDGAGAGAGAVPQDASARCATCHHDASSPLVPRLRGQSVAYLAAALDAYAGRQRHSGIMQPIAAAVEPARRREIADAVGGRADTGPAATAGPVPSSLVIAGDPARDIPACRECHGPGPGPRDPRYPALAGQPADYLRLQLTLFAEGRRGGSSYGEIMRAIAVRLTPAQMDEAAAAYAAMAGSR
jgi:cytochrome c553